MLAVMVLGVGCGAFGVWLVARRRRAQKLRSMRSVAEDLIPEIRELVEASDPKGRSGGDAGPAKRYEAARERLSQLLPVESLYAVETFYRCVDAYRTARSHMTASFAEDGDTTLGDRIRAKDARDRSLKDVYLTGEDAVQKLEKVLD